MKSALVMAASSNGSEPRDLESIARSLSLVAAANATAARARVQVAGLGANDWSAPLSNLLSADAADGEDVDGPMGVVDLVQDAGVPNA